MDRLAVMEASLEPPVIGYIGLGRPAQVMLHLNVAMGCSEDAGSYSTLEWKGVLGLDMTVTAGNAACISAPMLSVGHVLSRPIQLVLDLFHSTLIEEVGPRCSREQVSSRVCSGGLSRFPPSAILAQLYPSLDPAQSVRRSPVILYSNRFAGSREGARLTACASSHRPLAKATAYQCAAIAPAPLSLLLRALARRSTALAFAPPLLFLHKSRPHSRNSSRCHHLMLSRLVSVRTCLSIGARS